MIYLLLAFEFFKTGLFSYGGGYATIPFLYHISDVYHWYSASELSQMTAIAAITPGPVGINVATYTGLKTAGILGSMIATASEIMPSLLFVIVVSKLLAKFSNNFYVKSVIETLKPISCALLLSVGAGLLKAELSNKYSLILLCFLIIISWKSKKDPVFYMILAGCFGICLKVIGI